MQKIFKAVMAIAVTFLPFAWPQATSAAAGMSSSFVITQLVPREMGLDLITTSQTITSPANCRTDAVRLPSSAANYNVIASSLITAFAAGKTVHVWVTQCDTDNVGLIVAAWVDK